MCLPLATNAIHFFFKVVFTDKYYCLVLMTSQIIKYFSIVNDTFYEHSSYF